jgi:hypothetical protein
MNDALGFALVSTTVYAIRSQFTYEDQPHRLHERSRGRRRTAASPRPARPGGFPRPRDHSEPRRARSPLAATRLRVGRRASL